MAYNPRDYIIETPQMQGPLDFYKQAVSLRDLMDARRVRDIQVRQYALKARQEEREEAERQAFREAVIRGAKPEELIAASPELGFKYGTSLATLQREQRAAQDAELKRRAEVAKQISGAATGAMGEQDPLERALQFGRSLTDLINQGQIPASDFTRYRVPDQAQADAYYGQAYGQKELESLRQNRAAELRNQEEEARKAALFGPQYGKALAEKHTAQQTALGQQPIQPYQQAQLDKDPAAVQEFTQVFKPGWLQSRKLPDNPVNTYLAWQDFQQAKTPKLYTPEEEAQRIRMAKETAAAKPASGAENKAYGFWSRMKDAEDTLSRMEEHMKGKGLFAQAWYKYAPNFAQSEENQLMMQAQRQFTEARLRKESGAAIPQQEYEADARTYFPQPGDSPAVLARKKKARMNLMETVKKEAGRAYTPGEEAATEQPAPAPVVKWGKDANGNPVRLP